MTLIPSTKLPSDLSLAIASTWYQHNIYLSFVYLVIIVIILQFCGYLIFFLPCWTTSFFLVFKALLISWYLRNAYFCRLQFQFYVPPPQVSTFQGPGSHLLFPQIPPSSSYTYPLAVLRLLYFPLSILFLPKFYFKNFYYYYHPYYLLFYS